LSTFAEHLCGRAPEGPSSKYMYLHACKTLSDFFTFCLAFPPEGWRRLCNLLLLRMVIHGCRWTVVLAGRAEPFGFAIDNLRFGISGKSWCPGPASQSLARWLYWDLGCWVLEHCAARARSNKFGSREIRPRVVIRGVLVFGVEVGQGQTQARFHFPCTSRPLSQCPPSFPFGTPLWDKGGHSVQLFLFR
jgi:hypothetical protein